MRATLSDAAVSYGIAASAKEAGATFIAIG